MKKSEELLQQSREEDNDLKSIGIFNKYLREVRSEAFVENWLTPLSEKYKIEENNHKYSITTTEYGIIDVFPKKGKLLIRKQNKWVYPCIPWIAKNLYKNEK